MFWLTVGVVLGIWLDQTFTIPPLQDVISEIQKQYRQAKLTKKTP